jgi:hypothetical protein
VGEIGTLERFAVAASRVVYLSMATRDNSSGDWERLNHRDMSNTPAKAAMMVAVARHVEQVLI